LARVQTGLSQYGDIGIDFFGGDFYGMGRGFRWVLLKQEGQNGYGFPIIIRDMVYLCSTISKILDFRYGSSQILSQG